MNKLSSKVVAITGAGNGIGRALALECAARGANLALSDIKDDALQETAQLVKSFWREVRNTYRRCG
jgi:NAD(P)-dependent dehydrogenase (short-subunit alcohol dehydrogenase family)